MKEYEANKFDPIIIGYYDDFAVYLLPSETWHELQRYCLQEHDHFPFRKSTFFRLLRDRGIISVSKNGQPTIQKKINGQNQRVLKLIEGGIYEFFVTSVTDESNN